MSLKVTLKSGDAHVVQFDETTTLTVANTVQVQPGETYVETLSWSEITGVEVVDDAPTAGAAAQQTDTSAAPAAEPAPVEPVEPVENTNAGTGDATLESPATALDHAVTLPPQDALDHVDAALAKFPDDADLLAAKADLETEVAQQAGQ